MERNESTVSVISRRSESDEQVFFSFLGAVSSQDESETRDKTEEKTEPTASESVVKGRDDPEAPRPRRWGRRTARAGSLVLPGGGYSSRLGGAVEVCFALIGWEENETREVECNRAAISPNILRALLPPMKSELARQGI